MAKTKSKSKVVKGAAKAATATPRRQSPAVRSPNKVTTSRTSKGPSSKQDTVVALLRQRNADYLGNPDAVLTWEQVKARTRGARHD